MSAAAPQVGEANSTPGASIMTLSTRKEGCRWWRRIGWPCWMTPVVYAATCIILSPGVLPWGDVGLPGRCHDSHTSSTAWSEAFAAGVMVMAMVGSLLRTKRGSVAPPLSTSLSTVTGLNRFRAAQRLPLDLASVFAFGTVVYLLSCFQLRVTICYPAYDFCPLIYAYHTVTFPVVLHLLGQLVDYPLCQARLLFASTLCYFLFRLGAILQPMGSTRWIGYTTLTMVLWLLTSAFTVRLLLHGRRTLRPMVGWGCNAQTIALVVGVIAILLSWAAYTLVWLLLSTGVIVLPVAYDHAVWPLLDALWKVSAAFAAQLVADRLTLLEASFETELRLRVLDAEKQAAQASDTAKRHFMRYVLHEARVPLNTVVMGVEGLIMDRQQLLDSVPADVRGALRASPAWREHFETLDLTFNSSRAISKLLDDFLSLEKIEAGALQLEIAEFSLMHFAKQVMQSFIVPANLRGLQLVLIVQDLPRTAIGDVQRIRQVTCNLLSNAIKFSPEGGRLVLHISVFDAADLPATAAAPVPRSEFFPLRNRRLPQPTATASDVADHSIAASTRSGGSPPSFTAPSIDVADTASQRTAYAGAGAMRVTIFTPGRSAGTYNVSPSALLPPPTPLRTLHAASAVPPPASAHAPRRQNTGPGIGTLALIQGMWRQRLRKGLRGGSRSAAAIHPAGQMSFGHRVHVTNAPRELRRGIQQPRPSRFPFAGPSKSPSLPPQQPSSGQATGHPGPPHLSSTLDNGIRSAFARMWEGAHRSWSRSGSTWSASGAVTAASTPHVAAATAQHAADDTFAGRRDSELGLALPPAITVVVPPHRDDVLLGTPIIASRHTSTSDGGAVPEADAQRGSATAAHRPPLPNASAPTPRRADAGADAGASTGDGGSSTTATPRASATSYSTVGALAGKTVRLLSAIPELPARGSGHAADGTAASSTSSHSAKLHLVTASNGAPSAEDAGSGRGITDTSSGGAAGSITSDGSPETSSGPDSGSESNGRRRNPFEHDPDTSSSSSGDERPAQLPAPTRRSTAPAQPTAAPISSEQVVPVVTSARGLVSPPAALAPPSLTSASIAGQAAIAPPPPLSCSEPSLSPMQTASVDPDSSRRPTTGKGQRMGAWLRYAEPHLRIAVIDEGPGIAETDRSLLFQPFNQIRSGTGAKPVTGTGLGLAICRRIVDLSGGNIGVDSIEGKGAMFYFEIPLRGPPPGATEIGADIGVGATGEADAPRLTSTAVRPDGGAGTGLTMPPGARGIGSPPANTSAPVAASLTAMLTARLSPADARNSALDLEAGHGDSAANHGLTTMGEGSAIATVIAMQLATIASGGTRQAPFPMPEIARGLSLARSSSGAATPTVRSGSVAPATGGSPSHGSGLIPNNPRSLLAALAQWVETAGLTVAPSPPASGPPASRAPASTIAPQGSIATTSSSSTTSAHCPTPAMKPGAPSGELVPGRVLPRRHVRSPRSASVTTSAPPLAAMSSTTLPPPPLASLRATSDPLVAPQRAIVPEAAAESAAATPHALPLLGVRVGAAAHLVTEVAHAARAPAPADGRPRQQLSSSESLRHPGLDLTLAARPSAILMSESSITSGEVGAAAASAAGAGGPAVPAVKPPPIHSADLEDSEGNSGSASDSSKRGRRLFTRAVVIDDVKSNRDLFARLLRRLGAHDITCFADGTDAVALAAGMTPQERSMVLWFTDKEMPTMDGHDVARQLHALGALVIGVTGNALREDRLAFQEAGAVTVLTKPVMAHALVETLASLGVHLPCSKVPAPSSTSSSGGGSAGWRSSGAGAGGLAVALGSDSAGAASSTSATSAAAIGGAHQPKAST